MDLSRNDLIDRMTARKMQFDELYFDNLTAPPLYSLLPPTTVQDLYHIAHSVKYSGNIPKKFKMISELVKPYGFIKMSSGTNRLVYRHYDVDTIVLKTAIDETGIHDNPAEYANMQILKPFVPKLFEMDRTGAVGLFERVIPVTSKEEFLSIIDDAFFIIKFLTSNGFIMADIGTKFINNWGIRVGGHPVILDYPYLYKVDLNKLTCRELVYNPMTMMQEFCNGEIEFDKGVNFAFCPKCGKRYRVKELGYPVQFTGLDNRYQNAFVHKKVNTERRSNMKISFGYGNNLKTVDLAEKDPLNVSGQTTSMPQRPMGTSEKKQRREGNNDEKGNNNKVTYERGTVSQPVTNNNTDEKTQKQQIRETVNEYLSTKSFGFKDYDPETDTFTVISGNDEIKFRLFTNTVSEEAIRKMAENNGVEIHSQSDLDEIEDYKRWLTEAHAKADEMIKNNTQTFNDDIEYYRKQLKNAHDRIDELEKANTTQSIYTNPDELIEKLKEKCLEKDDLLAQQRKEIDSLNRKLETTEVDEELWDEKDVDDFSQAEVVTYDGFCVCNAFITDYASEIETNQEIENQQILLLTTPEGDAYQTPEDVNAEPGTCGTVVIATINNIPIDQLIIKRRKPKEVVAEEVEVKETEE